MQRGTRLGKAAAVLAAITLLGVQPASAQPCGYGYAYYPGYGCRAYNYNWPFALFSGLALGLLLHHHHKSHDYGYYGGGYPRGFARVEPGLGGAIARAQERRGGEAAHGIGRLGAGFGGGEPRRHEVAPAAIAGPAPAPAPAPAPPAKPHEEHHKH